MCPSVSLDIYSIIRCFVIDTLFNIYNDIHHTVNIVIEYKIIGSFSLCTHFVFIFRMVYYLTTYILLVCYLFEMEKINKDGMYRLSELFMHIHMYFYVVQLNLFAIKLLERFECLLFPNVSNGFYRSSSQTNWCGLSDIFVMLKL